MKWMLCLTLVSLTTLLQGADEPYDFRMSKAYAELSATDKVRLEQVRHDQVLLWGALDMYADEHHGNVPASLDELVPKYLKELPSDPFATEDTAKAEIDSGKTSKGGWGYRYKEGRAKFGKRFEGEPARNRSWAISSVGLPDFPYQAAKGNVGLYVCKGTWL